MKNGNTLDLSRGNVSGACAPEFSAAQQKTRPIRQRKAGLWTEKRFCASRANVRKLNRHRKMHSTGKFCKNVLNRARLQVF